MTKMTTTREKKPPPTARRLPRCISPGRPRIKKTGKAMTPVPSSSLLLLTFILLLCGRSAKGFLPETRFIKSFRPPDDLSRQESTGDGEVFVFPSMQMQQMAAAESVLPPLVEVKYRGKPPSQAGFVFFIAPNTHRHIS